MSSPEYIAEAKAYLSSMSEHDLEDSGDEFQRLFGYAMELSLALTARDDLLRQVGIGGPFHLVAVSGDDADAWYEKRNELLGIKRSRSPGRNRT